MWVQGWARCVGVWLTGARVPTHVSDFVGGRDLSQGAGPRLSTRPGGAILAVLGPSVYLQVYAVFLCAFPDGKVGRGLVVMSWFQGPCREGVWESEGVRASVWGCGSVQGPWRFPP